MIAFGMNPRGIDSIEHVCIAVLAGVDIIERGELEREEVLCMIESHRVSIDQLTCGKAIEQMEPRDRDRWDERIIMKRCRLERAQPVDATEIERSIGSFEERFERELVCLQSIFGIIASEGVCSTIPSHQPASGADPEYA